jgi:Dolichyl-phosphate-mannose-protein mannosyltransferase
MNVRRIVQALLMLIAATVFMAGINWGLPSRRDDAYLLGRDYHGLHLQGLTARVPEVDASRGADVVASDEPAGKPVVVNDTDAKRAQILCRYRLYSYQPDEMITFRSLSQMKPRQGDMDPRLYQYGGLWIYGVGALIQAGAAMGLLELTDRAVYLGNPELFGKFYVVARGYSAAWGLVGVWAVFALVRRMTDGKVLLSAMAAICFLFMPVVVTMAHEAKPHLAGAVLILLAVLAAGSFVKSPQLKWAIVAGLCCGAAAGMVLWGVISFILIPFMAGRRLKAGAVAGFTAVVVYAATNPYVIYHLVHDPSVLKSNLGNTAAMYHAGTWYQGIGHGLLLILAGTGPAILAVGVVGSVIVSRQGTGRLLAAVAIATLIPFLAMAAGKPGEYARFALLPDVALLIAGFAAIGRPSVRPFMRPLFGLGMVILTIGPGLCYLNGFMKDASGQTSRRAVARDLAGYLQSRSFAMRPRLGLFADPAPYCLPPVDLEVWDIVRLPKGSDGKGMVDVIVRPDDAVRPWRSWETPISWADKPFEVLFP